MTRQSDRTWFVNASCEATLDRILWLQASIAFKFVNVAICHPLENLTSIKNWAHPFFASSLSAIPLFGSLSISVWSAFWVKFWEFQSSPLKRVFMKEHDLRDLCYDDIVSWQLSGRQLAQLNPSQTLDIETNRQTPVFALDFVYTYFLMALFMTKLISWKKSPLVLFMIWKQWLI